MKIILFIIGLSVTNTHIANVYATKHYPFSAGSMEICQKEADKLNQEFLALNKPFYAGCGVIEKNG